VIITKKFNEAVTFVIVLGFTLTTQISLAAIGVGESDLFSLNTTYPDVQLISPGDGWTLPQTVAFTWASYPEATGYYIEVSTTGEQNYNSAETQYCGEFTTAIISEEVTFDTTWTSPTDFFTISDDYYWHVTAILGDIASDFSETWSFSSPLGDPNGGIQGIVRSTFGDPLIGAIVSLGGGWSDTTDADGYYSMQGVYPGYHTLNVNLEGFAAYESDVEIAAGSMTVFDISLSPEIVITIAIQDYTGNGISGAQVAIVPPIVSSQSTDGNGECSFSVSPGSYAFNISAIGYIDREVEEAVYEYACHLPIQIVLNQASSVPVYIFLIRGISMAPVYWHDEGDWSYFVSQYESEYGSSENVFPVSIHPCETLEYNALQLANSINSEVNDSDARIVIIGHSMGGIIARKYLSLYHAFPAHRVSQVDRIFTIDSPHFGSNFSTLANWSFWFAWLFDDCPAYEELGYSGMASNNNVMLQQEENLSTHYILIGSSDCDFENQCRGDFVVFEDSQMGTYVFPTSMNDRIHRFLVERQSNQEWETTLHESSQYDPEIVSYILNQLNIPVEDLEGNDGRGRESEIVDESIVIQKGAAVVNYETKTDSFMLASATVMQVTALGVFGDVNWTLESPSTVFENGVDFINAGGSYGSDEDNNIMFAALPYPESGMWRWQVESQSSDTTFVAVQVTANIPLNIVPIQFPETIPLGSAPLLTALVSTVGGISVDSVRADLMSQDNFITFHDDGTNGDQLAGDGVWSSVVDTLQETGLKSVYYSAFAHAGTALYQSCAEMSFVVTGTHAQLMDEALFRTVDADSNGLYESLRLVIPLYVDSIGVYHVSCTLTDTLGNTIAASASIDSLGSGSDSLAVDFDGGLISDSQESGRFSVGNVFISTLIGSQYVHIVHRDSLCSSGPFSYLDFEGRFNPVQNVGCVRNGEQIEVFWTSHSAPDIDHYQVYYDPDGLPPYEGVGLNEGDSPVVVEDVLMTFLSGADSLQSFTFVVTAVDYQGHESLPSYPYTVFAYTSPDAIADLTIQIIGSDYVLSWEEVPGGAMYRIENAPSPYGPWTPVAETYSTWYQRPLPEGEPLMFFRVIAVR